MNGLHCRRFSPVERERIKMSARRVRFCVWVFVVSSLASVADAQEWSRFRGPNGSGISDAKTIPVKWTDSEIRWKAKLPGEGISSPVVWGEKIFVTAAEPDIGQRHLICLRARMAKNFGGNRKRFGSTRSIRSTRLRHVLRRSMPSVSTRFGNRPNPPHCWHSAMTERQFGSSRSIRFPKDTAEVFRPSCGTISLC